MIPIICQGLSIAFGGVRAVDSLNLDVPNGAIYGLVGPNGAGKTSAIKAMMNILRPTSGRAEILGCDSRLLGAENFAQIGYVSENQAMPDWMTIDYLIGISEAVLSNLGQWPRRGTVAAIRSAARAQAPPPFTRHVDEGGAGFVALLPAAAHCAR
jgi:ABC-type Mn2+/Zn2+ transport system ATPase subunit